MKDWQYLLAVTVIVILLLAIRSAVIKKRNDKKREFARKLETVLQPKETVKVICPQKKGSCVLTSKRLLFDTREGFTAVPLTAIKRVQGVTAEGKATVSAAKMKYMTVKAEKEYTVYNTAEEFPELAKQLKNAVRRRSETKANREKK